MKYVLYPFVWIANILLRCFCTWPIGTLVAIVALCVACVIAEYAATGSSDSSGYITGFNAHQRASGRFFWVIP